MKNRGGSREIHLQTRILCLRLNKTRPDAGIFHFNYIREILPPVYGKDHLDLSGCPINSRYHVILRAQVIYKLGRLGRITHSKSPVDVTGSSISLNSGNFEPENSC